ncbi:MAG: hypothetical protein A2Y73_00785 [Chloroflexi bacterium RBG_13_56_8]|nr:MAG: hypothetical protein A2Y73_00785 [Chloroflexi bacterium RBG_13_56_8]
MYLSHLSLTSFRNYTRLEIDLPARINVLVGENAQGKTNLLEAIYYLATTKSPLASLDRQLINWAADEEVMPYARVEGVYTRAGEMHTIEATLLKEPRPRGDSVVMTFRRQVRLDGVRLRTLDAVGKLNVVLFMPEDISLVSGSPGGRRRYLDITLCQIDPLYCRSLSQYNRVMSQRNALLRQIRERAARADELEYWDQQLSAHGAYLLARRLWAVDQLGQDVQPIHKDLTGGREQIALQYVNSIMERLGDGELQLAIGGDLLGERSEWEGRFRQALRAARREEIARGVTVVGPHRDDLRFLLNGVDATIYASRGQQRTVTLAIKLAEVAFMRRQTGEMPVLLLDDFLSELDRKRCEWVLQAISRAQQVLITTTDLSYFRNDFLASAVLWRVAERVVSPLERDSLATS